MAVQQVLLAWLGYETVGTVYWVGYATDGTADLGRIW